MTATTATQIPSPKLHRQQPALAGRVAWLLAFALSLFACASIEDPRVTKTRESLIGVPARQLSRCLGPASDVEMEGDTEYLTFTVYEREPAPTPPRQPTSRPDFPEPRPLRRVAYCELRFEVTGGHVRAVEVSGRRSDGLASSACIFDHATCLSGSKTQ